MESRGEEEGSSEPGGGESIRGQRELISSRLNAQPFSSALSVYRGTSLPHALTPTFLILGRALRPPRLLSVVASSFKIVRKHP